MHVMEISCAFAPSLSSPQHIAIAEELGYCRAWCYDSPALYADVWMVLALAARRTSRISLGPAVLVPSLRHPMVNAAAVASLAQLAPGRVAVALGAGFTGRHTLGQRPMRWSEVTTYIEVVRALLRGEEAMWEGAVIKMMHPAGFAPERPIMDIPIVVAADGPKGRDVARALGDGVFGTLAPPPSAQLPNWRVLLAHGTVLGELEELTDERVLECAGHGVGVIFHAKYERGGAAAVDRLPGGRLWREAIEQVPLSHRHLAIHEDHLVKVSDRDRPAVIEGASLLTNATLTGTAADLRNRVEALAAAGVTEVVYQPAGGDIPAELARFIAAVS
jgi:5,10-methylenetetrahydromethanopterin reductase